MDWTKCQLVEVVPGKVSGAPLIKGTRVPADTVVENRELGVDGIVEQFHLPRETVAALLVFWRSHSRAA